MFLLRPRVWLGEVLRWYLTKARHPFKAYLVGHYWWIFCKPRTWIRYDDLSVISVCLREYIQQRIFFDGLYEQPVVNWLKQTLRDTDIFWDVGANIGAVTLIAAPRCRRVVAFEPDPRSFERLACHLRVNRVVNVELIAAALDDRTGDAVLNQAGDANTGLSSLTSRAAEVVATVHVRTLSADDFVNARPLLAPDIMKIDVEGMEHRVLEGALRVLRSGRVRAIIYEDRAASDGRPSNTGIVAHLAAFGYQVQPLGASAENVGDGMFNYLATPVLVQALHA